MKVRFVRQYTGESSYTVEIGEVRRELPLVNVAPHLWIASDARFILGDVQLISEAARMLCEKIERTRSEIILTAEAKSIALAFELSKRLGHSRFVVARKSLKSYMGDHIKEKVKSITTGPEQELLLTAEEIAAISGRRVCLLDDVVSTGGTFRALDALVEKAGGSVVCKAAIWREGPWYDDPRLVVVDALPVFVDEQSKLKARTWHKQRKSR